MREKLRKVGGERDWGGAGHYISFYWPYESNVELISSH